MPYEVPRNQDATEFKGGKTILASIHFLYTEEGGTIDAAAVGDRYVELGEPFVFNETTKKYVPFVSATHVTTGALNAGFSDPVICHVDFNCDGVNDVVVGELIYTGTFYDKKLPAKVTADFKALTQPLIRYNSRGL